VTYPFFFLHELSSATGILEKPYAATGLVAPFRQSALLYEVHLQTLPKFEKKLLANL